MVSDASLKILQDSLLKKRKEKGQKEKEQKREKGGK